MRLNRLPRMRGFLVAGATAVILSTVGTASQAQGMFTTKPSPKDTMCSTLGTVSIRALRYGVTLEAGDTLNFAEDTTSKRIPSRTVTATEVAELATTTYKGKKKKKGSSVLISSKMIKKVRVAVPGSFTATTADTVYISQRGKARITVSCTPGGTSAAVVDGRSQSQAIDTALFNVFQSRRGGGSNGATQNQLFFATRNLVDGTSNFDTPEFNAWVALEGRRFEGDSEGNSANLSFGVDQELANGTILGGFFGYSHQKLTTATVTTTSKSPALGGYASFTLGQNLFLDTHIGFARPSYEVGSGSFTANRAFAGLSLNGRIDHGAVQYAPFVTLRAVREKQPSYVDGLTTIAENTVTSHVGSVGLRLEALNSWSGGFKPYASFAVDFAKSSETTGADDNFVSPRVGFGGSYATKSGLLSVDFDLGKVGSDTRDFGANISYEFNF